MSESGKILKESNGVYTKTANDRITRDNTFKVYVRAEKRVGNRSGQRLTIVIRDDAGIDHAVETVEDMVRRRGLMNREYDTYINGDELNEKEFKAVKEGKGAEWFDYAKYEEYI